MVGTRQSRPLLEALIAGTRLPWYVATILIGAFFLVLLAVAFFLEHPSRGVTWANLRGPLQPLSVVLYVLAIYPLMARLKENAIASLSPLLDDLDSSRVIADGFSSPKMRAELVSVLVGLVVWTGLSQPWRWVVNPLAVYAAGVDALMFGILGFLVLHGLDGTIRVSRMTRRRLKLDVFDVDRLVPVSNWSLAISMAFVGGLSISIAFQNLNVLRQWQTALVYVLLIAVALAVFFISMWSTHSAIHRAKKAELVIVERNLEAAFRELRSASHRAGPPGDEKVYSAVTAWAAYERRLREVPEWPYGGNLARRLAASVLLPGAVYVVKLLFGLRV